MGARSPAPHIRVMLKFGGDRRVTLPFHPACKAGASLLCHGPEKNPKPEIRNPKEGRNPNAEADESGYWVRLLSESGKVEKSGVAPLLAEANGLVAIAISSINTARCNSDTQE